MKIILAAINSKYIHSNLAVYSLKAYAREYQNEIDIEEYTINQTSDDILMDLYKKKPDVLCFSCYIWNLSYVEELVEEFHKVCPDVPIWVGGPEVSYDAEDVLRRLPSVFGVMRGEGEETFLELLQYYHGQNDSLKNVSGIVYRDGDVICQNPWRDVLDMSKIPFVYDDMSLFEHKIIYYESSRGCPFSCSYCLSSIDKKLRFRDLELVKKELQFFIDNEVPQVKFVDRTFNCKHEHAMAIWKYIHEHDQGKTNFHFEVSADLLNEAELLLLADMRPGLVQLEIGVQSTHQATIREIRRTMTFERVAEVVKRIQDKGNIHQHLDLIAGLPYEDLKIFKKSFDDVYSLRPEQLQLGFLKVLKGSYMEAKKEDYELVYKNHPPYEVRSTKWLSYADVLELKSVEEMVEVYYNSGQFRNTLEHLIGLYVSPYEFYQKLATYYEKQDLHLVNHSRATRYEILMDYITKYHEEEKELCKELLTFDFYLRENAKSRPFFAGENRASKEELKQFYEIESQERKYLQGYESYDKRQLRKMTHVEEFSYDVLGDKKPSKTLILFDYHNRNPLTYEARVFCL